MSVPPKEKTTGSAPLTPENHWEDVTVQNVADRKGPQLKRIGVPGGWLYIALAQFGGTEAPSLVFVEADRS